MAISKTPEIAIRSAAPTNGGTPAKPNLIASQVLPQIQHTSAKSKYVRIVWFSKNFMSVQTMFRGVTPEALGRMYAYGYKCLRKNPISS
jgi:hypothetical protein